MSRTAISIGLAGLAVVGLSACATENKTAEKTTSASASTTTTTTTVTATATSTVTTTSTATSSSATTSATPTSSSSASPTTSTSAPMVGGMTECTKEALAEPAAQAAQAMGADNLYTVDSLNCSDGWAVTGGKLANKDNPDMGAPTSFVFQQEGQFWVLQDKTKVCGTNPTTTTAPADATIPAALFVAGCAAG